MSTYSPWPALAGTCDRLALFVKNGRSAVLDTSDRTVIETGPTPELLGRFNWQPTYPGLIAESVHQQAALALGDSVKSIPSLAPVASGGSRTYAVPKQVQATAQRALAAATAPDAIAQADPIAVATARSLATGIPVTLPKLRQIARALSIRHTVTPAGLANQPGQTAQDATGAVYLLWGGNAARRWANGVINREDARAQNQFAAQALRAAAADAAVAPDDGTAPDTAQDDDLPPTDDMSPDEFNKTMFSGDIVPQEWFQTFYDSIAEGPHGFAESPDRPNLCLYCGAPFYFNIHDVNNRWINEPDKPHFYSESDTNPDICAICNQPPNSELHHIDLSTGAAPEPDATAPEPQALAAYTPYHAIDASPGVLAALMSAEQALGSQVQYYAAVAPDDPGLAVRMFRNQGDAWSVWSDGVWTEAGWPAEPLQLLDDDTAFSLVRFGLPTSIPAFDLEERALFEAARETLGLDDIVTVDAPPDGGVTYQVQTDIFEPNTGLGLSAICGDNTYIWDYGTGTWEQSEFGLPDGTDVAEVPLETAISVAAQLLDHGSADLAGGDSSLMDDIQALEGTGFNDLPQQDQGGYDDSEDGWDEQDGGDGEHLDDDQIQRLFFMLQDTDDPGLALSLHAHPDPDTWQVWDPQDIVWRPEDAPDLSSLIPSDHTQAAEFAAWQYMAAHGVDTLDATTITAAADRLATAQSAADFVTGYSAVLLYRAPRKMSLHHVESLVAAPAPDVLYTPEERSKNASKQVRDRFGRFAHANSPVQLKSGETGHITSIDPVRKTVTVTDSNGNVHDVPANSVTLIDEPQGKSGGGGGPAIPPLDLNAIPAQPRAGARTVKASLPYLLPPMDKAALDKMFADYQAWVDQQRKNSGG